MNDKQKQKRLMLAIALVALLAVILGIAALVGCNADRCGGSSGGGDVIISEILVTNKETVKDPFGGYGDYIELYNKTDHDIDLTGYTLTDDEKSSWSFPDGTVIPANGYLVVWCVKGVKDSDGNGALRANFQLSTKVRSDRNNQHDVLRLTHRSGIVIDTIDLATTFSNLYTGSTGSSKSFVRTGSGWDTMDPTPGFPNTEEGRQAYLASIGSQRVEPESGTSVDPSTVQKIGCQVRLTEFMPSNGSTHKAPNGEYCDWIELYNSGDDAFNLSGYHLSDEIEKYYKYTFPEGTYIGAKQYLVLYHTEQTVAEYQREYLTDEEFLRFEFGLSASGGEVVTFSDPDGNIIDAEAFDQVQKDTSFERVYTNDMFDPNGKFAPQDRPTPGFENTYNGRTQFEKKEFGEMGVHDIIINEVLVDGYYITYEYSSSTKSDRPMDADLGSWIELYNRSDEPVNLSGFSISDNEKKPRKWVFPDGTSIAAKGYLVLQLEGSLPREYKDSDKDVTSEMTRLTLNFDIAAAGETVYMYDASGSMIDRVTVPEAHACVSYGRDASGAWKLFDKPTEGAENDTNGRGLYCEAATADTHSGIYQGIQTVNITVPDGCYATYTLSCGKENDPVKTTAPTESSDRVSGPIAIKENTVLRIRTFAADGSRYPSDIQSYTYVIIGDEETVEAHNTNLPVVFLVTEPENLWDTKYGIMVKGEDYTGKGEADEMRIGKNEDMGKYANFNMRGRMWEKEATFTYTDAGGKNVLYETDLNIRVFGAFSRKIAQKGIALIARKGVGSSRLDYKFFSSRPEFTSYKSLVLRASGQDAALSRIRDVLVQSLLDDAKVDIANQAFVQCIVYINGQYWGVYNLREKISKHYLAQHYGINDEDTIDVLKGNGNNDQCIVASNGYTSYNQGLKDYKDLIAYCENRNCDLSDPSAYDYVCSQIDAEQFAMYCAFEIIIGNTDTGNIKWWRSTELDNKWRWIQYDYCWAMNGDNPSQAADKSTGFRRDYFWRYFDPAGHGAGKNFSTVLGRSMLSNNEFVKIFLDYCAYFYKEVYTPEKINAKVTELQENIRKEMETYDLVRWRPYHDLSTKGWNSHVNKIRNYADNFQDWYLYYCQHFINEHTNYHLSDDEMIQRFGKVGKIS